MPTPSSKLEFSNRPSRCSTPTPTKWLSIRSSPPSFDRMKPPWAFEVEPFLPALLPRAEHEGHVLHGGEPFQGARVAHDLEELAGARGDVRFGFALRFGWVIGVHCAVGIAWGLEDPGGVDDLHLEGQAVPPARGRVVEAVTFVEVQVDRDPGDQTRVGAPVVIVGVQQFQAGRRREVVEDLPDESGDIQRLVALVVRCRSRCRGGDDSGHAGGAQARLSRHAGRSRILGLVRADLHRAIGAILEAGLAIEGARCASGVRSTLALFACGSQHTRKGFARLFHALLAIRFPGHARIRLLPSLLWKGRRHRDGDRTQQAPDDEIHENRTSRLAAGHCRTSTEKPRIESELPKSHPHLA